MVTPEMHPAARDRWLTAAVLGSMAAVLLGLVGVGFAMRAIDETKVSDTTSSEAEVAGARTFAISLTDLDVTPEAITVASGTDVTLDVTNDGAVPHDLKLDGHTGTDMLDPGDAGVAALGPVMESAQAWCTIPGHKEAGMVLDITVEGSAAADEAPKSAAAEIDFAAKPGDDFRPFDPALRPAPEGREHTLTLRATEKVIEVAPGVTQELWTFNDQVPGPVLRGRVGDLFTITLVNEGKLGHSIDFHASKVAWNEEMRTIKPGESLIYQFEAKHSGAFMYHCGTAPALHHIGNGMFGAIVIDPPGLAPVAHEYLFVQSELYLGPEGKPGDLTKMVAEAADAVVFNGYASQYLHRPIRVEPGERIRAWVIDAGPSENSSFHVVGTIFDTLFKEGAYRLQPGPSRGGSQALDLQPSQGGFAEFSFDEPGLYPIVTHKFSNVGRGALGLFQAGDVAPAGGGH